MARLARIVGGIVVAVVVYVLADAVGLPLLLTGGLTFIGAMVGTALTQRLVGS